MHFDVRTEKTDLSEAVRGYVERRLRFALGRFGERVGTVGVRIFSDGAQMHCRMTAEGIPFGTVTVTEADVDLFGAIDRAAGRMGRAFARHLERGRNFGRQTIRAA